MNLITRTTLLAFAFAVALWPSGTGAQTASIGLSGVCFQAPDMSYSIESRMLPVRSFDVIKDDSIAMRVYPNGDGLYSFQRAPARDNPGEFVAIEGRPNEFVVTPDGQRFVYIMFGSIASTLLEREALLDGISFCSTEGSATPPPA